MSVGYTSVQWNRHKKIYDAVILGGVALTVAAFAGVSLVARPGITAETLILRTSALAALLLLHVVLAIGPLARLDRRFLPLLYNRRHLGVTLALLAVVHAVFAIVQFHALGDANPFVSALGAYRQDYLPGSDLPGGGPWSPGHVPFEVFGFGALLILLVMAATSHDFWNRNLGASFWKTLHVLVLVAYGLLVLHVAFGVLQSETSSLYLRLLGVGLVGLLFLHLLAAFREARLDRRRVALTREGFERACLVEEVREGRGKTVWVGGQRLAVFRHQERLFATANVCRHQGGPLGEGKIVDGCITCPWHGWQYRPEDGCSPPPFQEVVATYPLALVEGEVYVNPRPNPLKTASEGVAVPGSARESAEDPAFYVGYLPMPPRLASFAGRIAAALLVLLPLVAGAVAWAQQRFDRGVFEFGVYRTFEGVLYEEPLPMLHLSDPGPANLLLVGAGKFGLPEVARGHHGRKVRFEGSLIYRQGLTVVEFNRPETFEVLGPPAAGEERGPARVVGPVRLAGELVDTKCFAGVMRPAVGKVHRACAVRCLSGGIPPGLLVRGTGPGGVETGTVFLLAGPEGETLEYDVRWAAREVLAAGELAWYDEMPVLRVARLELLP